LTQADIDRHNPEADEDFGDDDEEEDDGAAIDLDADDPFA
jgi:hypothetical protein